MWHSLLGVFLIWNAMVGCSLDQTFVQLIKSTPGKGRSQFPENTNICRFHAPWYGDESKTTSVFKRAVPLLQLRACDLEEAVKITRDTKKKNSGRETLTAQMQSESEFQGTSAEDLQTSKKPVRAG